MTNRYNTTEEQKQKFIPIIQEFINRIESASEDEVYSIQLNLTDQGINPYQIWSLLNDLGYEDDYVDHNGWELDFWIKFEKEGFKTITMTGTGITFEVLLEVQEWHQRQVKKH